MRRGCHDLHVAATTAGRNMAMKALRGMMNGAMSELSSAVSGTRPTAIAPVSATTTAASREHVMAVSRDYISQPRLSESVNVRKYPELRSSFDAVYLLKRRRRAV